MEISYSELRSKIVVNLIDGRKLGHIVDLIFDQQTAKVLGIVVPGTRSMCSIFRPREDIFISYHNICKIGEDTILVELNPMPPIHPDLHPAAHAAPRDCLQNIWWTLRQVK